LCVPRERTCRRARAAALRGLVLHIRCPQRERTS
jgi:hypothetical protein